MGRPLPSLLESALQEARVEGVLRELALRRFGAAAEVRGVSAEVLERRVVRYSVELAPAGNGGVLVWPVIGKVYEPARLGEQGYRALRWLGESGFGQAAPRSVSLPEAHAYVGELQLVLMEQVPGESLKRLIKTHRAGPEHMRRFAGVLLKLHRFPASFAAPSTVDDFVSKRCHGLADPLGTAFPELAAPITAILETARREPWAAPALVHGDFHPGQVHFDGQELCIVDLDHLHQGDPAYDVATVFVSLKHLELVPERAEHARALRAAFLEEYFSGQELALAARVPLNVALVLLKRACKRFLYRDEPGWEELVRRQIGEAQACLALHAETPAPRSLDDILALCARCPGAA